MRETCARVLAAALMAAAIATVAGMAALFGVPSDPGRPITAPPSSLERTVRLTAHLAPRHVRPAPRLVTTHTTSRALTRSEMLGQSVVVVRKQPKKRPPKTRQLAETIAPAPPVAGPAAELVPAPAPAPPAAEDQADGPGHGHGHGHAYGRDKQDE